MNAWSCIVYEQFEAVYWYLSKCAFRFCVQDSYIQSRADTMKNIEQTIVELGSIFQQLAHMVKEQEEMVQRWEDNFKWR